MAQDTAIQMAKLCGRPIQGLQETLTDSGVVAYDAYSEFLAEGVANYFDAHGNVRAGKLPKEDLTRHSEARRSPEASLTDKWTLATTAPELFHEIHEHNLAAEKSLEPSRKKRSGKHGPYRTLGEPIVELESVVVRYGDKVVLGNDASRDGTISQGLNLAIHRGTRLALLGPNGSGKTTLLSLLTSDHPQSYSLPIKFFGRSRLPEPGKPGLSLWEIQSRIGHSAPEVHAFFPKRLTVRQVLESAWAETFISRPKLSHERDELVDSFLRWWESELRQDRSPSTSDADRVPKTFSKPVKELIESCFPAPKSLNRLWREQEDESYRHNHEDCVDWADDRERHAFGVLPFGTQRLLLLLRAIIKQPDILILDEAFSGLSVEVRDKAMCFLEYGETKFVKAQAEFESGRSAKRPPSPALKQTLHNNHRVDLERVLAFIQADESSVATHARSLFASEEKLRSKAAEVGQEIEQGGWAFYPQLADYRFTGLTDRQALVVVSHIKEEIPSMCDQWLRLPGEEEVQEEGRGIEMGWVDQGALGEEWWRIWGSSS